MTEEQKRERRKKGIGSQRKGIKWSEAFKKRLSKKNRGSNSFRAKLNEDKVEKIKKLMKKGCQNSEIARMFNVNKTTISYIRRKKTWRHVNPQMTFKKGTTDGSHHWKSKLTEKDVKKIKKLFKSKTNKEIAVIYNVNPTTIDDIKKGKSWDHVK